MPDRVELLRGQTELTGIDFLDVMVETDPVTLVDTYLIDVYFHVEPDDLDVPMVGDVTAGEVAITSRFARERSPIGVVGVAWPDVAGRTVLRLTIEQPGEFVPYRLAIDDARLDPYFNDVPFSFQAGCPSRLDCAPAERFCPDDLPAPPPIDYTARDMWSMTRAMLDAATVLEPAWTDRHPADQLVMLTEALASIGDEFSYTQDRIRDEACLDRATQRRSLRRHAQLVDHRMHDGLGASTWLAVIAGGPVGIGNLPAGTVVWAETEEGARIEFAVGFGLRDELAGEVFQVDQRRNAMTPHISDDDRDCLPAGATSIDVVGHVGAAFPSPGDPVMVALHERPAAAGVPTRTWYLPVVSATETTDALVLTQPGPVPTPITRLEWLPGDAPPFDLQLADTVVHGNIVPATVGATRTSDFLIGPDLAGTGLPSAVEREGPHGSTEFLYSLPGSDQLGLVWRPHDAAERRAIGGGHYPRHTAPELVVQERRDPDPAVEWEWRPHLVGPGASTPDDRHVTLDDGFWGDAVTYRRSGATLVHVDWLDGRGLTIRFGDGEFGSPPPDGATFTAHYRLGNGRLGNLPAGALRHIDTADPLVVAVTNLTPSTDGVPPETVEEMKRLAPYLWQTITYRAVRTEDYAEALTRLDWVQNAGAKAAFTGSWLSIVATPDPRDAVAMTAEWRDDAFAQLDRFRQAGRDVLVGEPRYADLEIDIEVCVEPTSYQGTTIAEVLTVLLGDRRTDPTGSLDVAFFDPDRFGFGTPLYRAALEAAVQSAPGVRAVDGILYRRLGHVDWQPMPAVVVAGDEELIRVVNDPAHPRRGTVRVVARGGA